MRKRRAWAERLRTRWLELVLLGGFLGLVVWFGLAALPMARSLIDDANCDSRTDCHGNRNCASCKNYCADTDAGGDSCRRSREL